MMDHPLTASLPSEWWRPRARPEHGNWKVRVSFALFFLSALPLAVVGWHRFAAFRIVSLVAMVFGLIGGKTAIGLLDLGDRALLFPLFDRFWGRLSFRTFLYEPELNHLLSNIRSGAIDLFLDGGANIGLWSMEASRVAANVLAVEASRATLPLLRMNSGLGGRRFEVVERALWRNSGEKLSFSWNLAKHAGASLTSVSKHDVSKPGWNAELVETISVDELIEQRGLFQGEGLLIVKLDVEGAEKEVMEGAACALASDRTLLVYEDHGKDALHQPTKHVLACGLVSYHLGPKGIKKIETLADVQSIKRLASTGYNFMACRAGGIAESLLLEAARRPLFAFYMHV